MKKKKKAAEKSTCDRDEEEARGDARHRDRCRRGFASMARGGRASWTRPWRSLSLGFRD